MGIRILTDSTCDLSAEQAREAEIQILPLKVCFGDEVYVDGVDLTKEAFYQKLAASHHLPTTAQVNPEEFCGCFEQARQAGDAVIGIFLSSELSGTYQSAVIAREMCGGEIYLIDSRTVTFGLALLVTQAVKLKKSGKTAREIVETLEEMKGKLSFYAAVDTLKYLKKGGRLSGTAAMMGGLLHIKPLIGIVDGKVEAIAKARGMGAAQDWLLERFRQETPDMRHGIFFGHTNAAAACEAFQQKVLAEAGDCDHKIIDIGSVVATHAGPGCVGFSYFKK
ncbi:DegV family protein [Acidaminobacterium chupaoyuni]